ncbi:MAG: hypothetical protein H6661_08960 [Ardenticatenaceae bacterium]|nr:hypothetical protein [Ardenticatenaceae bacterium]
MITRIGSLLLLLLVTFALYAIDLWGLGVSPLLPTAPALLLLVAVIDVAVISLALSQAEDAGWSLAGRLALLIFGVKTAVVVVETVYLPDVLPLAWIPGLLVNGGVTALLLALAAVWLNGRWPGTVATALWFPWSRLSWKRGLATGFLWMVLFVATGLLIFQPVARALDRAAADAYLAAFTPENPLLILAFQAGRGLLWALLAWPFLNNLRGTIWRRGLVLGLLFAGLMGSAQLQAIDLLPDAIWPAHLAEVMVENFLFGFVVAWGLRPLPAKRSTDDIPHLAT